LWNKSTFLTLGLNFTWQTKYLHKIHKFIFGNLLWNSLTSWALKNRSTRLTFRLTFKWQTRWVRRKSHKTWNLVESSFDPISFMALIFKNGSAFTKWAQIHPLIPEHKMEPTPLWARRNFYFKNGLTQIKSSAHVNVCWKWNRNKISHNQFTIHNLNFCNHLRNMT
jgi:hypothetical protein